jgi:hypothetical protein
MARKSLRIVTNDAVKRVLGSLGSPLVQVAVKGRVVSGAAANTLVIENVSTSRSTTLPIVASPAAKQALAGTAGSQEIALLGRVVQSAGGNVLLLDRVANANKLTISANAGTRKLLGDLAGKKGGEASLTAKVVVQGGRKVLVLAGGEGSGKKR